jgi:HAD superfamily hydrolase (TIGR01509 family)
MNVFSNKKLFLFDYDGTIANTSNIHQTAFSYAINNPKIKFKYSEIEGLGTEEAFRLIFQKNDLALTSAESKKLVSLKRSKALKLSNQKVELLPNFLLFINEAKTQFQLAIVSSGSLESILAGLRLNGLTNLFDPIISREDVKISKPSPEGFNIALKHFPDIDRKDALIFEDSIHGIEAARHAKIDFVNIKKYDWLYLYKQLIKSCYVK